MAARRDPVHELYEKIFGLMDLTGFTANLQAFCDAAGVSRDGLKACLFDNGTRGLNREYQKALAAFVGFRLDWPEWVETDRARIHAGQRRDTAQAFLDRCRKQGLPKCDPVASGTGTFTAERKRNTGIPLKKGSECQVPSKIPGLASILGLPAQYGRGRVDLGFELSCGTPALIRNCRPAIRRGYVRVDCGKALLSRETRKGFGQPYEVQTDFGCWHIGWDAATLQAPRWWVEAVGRPSIGNVEVPPDFATVEALAAGDILRLSFCVWRKDYDLQTSEAAPPPDNEEIAVVDKSGNEIALSSEELSFVKQRIIAVIGKEAALPDDGSGFVVLAAHEIELIASGQ